jgi:DNA-binding NtrC family response regulator
LAERPADIPGIFRAILTKRLAAEGCQPNSVDAVLDADFFETLCLHGFPKNNVRGIIDLADRIVVKTAMNTEPHLALRQSLAEIELTSFLGVCRHSSIPKADAAPTQNQDNREGQASRYESNKAHIIATYKRNEGNLSATVRELSQGGFNCSRRWIRHFIALWGEKD